MDRVLELGREYEEPTRPEGLALEVAEATDCWALTDGEVADAVARDTLDNYVMPCLSDSMVILDARSFWRSADSGFARQIEFHLWPRDVGTYPRSKAVEHPLGDE
jgi:hypothetical protein